MRASKEYQVCKAIAIYLRMQYPGVLYHFDLAGLNLSKAQAGMSKAIQHSRGWPDLFIAAPRGGYHGLFLEIKAEGTRLLKLNHTFVSDHIEEQADRINDLCNCGYFATFAVGFDQAKNEIDRYMKL